MWHLEVGCWKLEQVMPRLVSSIRRQPQTRHTTTAAVRVCLREMSLSGNCFFGAFRDPLHAEHRYLLMPTQAAGAVTSINARGSKRTQKGHPGGLRSNLSSGKLCATMDSSRKRSQNWNNDLESCVFKLSVCSGFFFSRDDGYGTMSSFDGKLDK